MDTNRERVHQCIVDLTNQRRPAARALVAQLLNEKLSVVDDAVKRLKEDGLVRTVVPGILEPVEQFPPSRAISRTLLPDGRSKVEIGDAVLDLTPHEAQVLGMMFMGDAQSLTYWHEERRAGEQLVRLEALVRAQQLQLRDMQRALARAPRAIRQQPDLFHENEAVPVRARRGPHVTVN